jgi:tRNA threonylcarbamoyladenosine biosynthesis protein TsaE
MLVPAKEPFVLNRLVLRSASDEATQSLGAALGDTLAAGDVLLLSGDLGAGKTRLTKGIARGLGVSEPVTSPTFNMMLVHEGRLPLYHFDLYRLDEPSQLEELDYFGTIEADGVSVVEWGDRFSEARPPDGVIITLRIESDDARIIEASSLGERGDQLLGALRQACGALSGVSCEDSSRQ